MENIDYLIIDEFSMLGESLLKMLDSRLRQREEDCHDLPFGGINIILAGLETFFKFLLPPVKDRALYTLG